jgi:hypothetical protein
VIKARGGRRKGDSGLEGVGEEGGDSKVCEIEVCCKMNSTRQGRAGQDRTGIREVREDWID